MRRIPFRSKTHATTNRCRHLCNRMGKSPPRKAVVQSMSHTSELAQARTGHELTVLVQAGCALHVIDFIDARASLANRRHCRLQVLGRGHDVGVICSGNSRAVLVSHQSIALSCGNGKPLRFKPPGATSRSRRLIQTSNTKNSAYQHNVHCIMMDSVWGWRR